MEISFDRPPKPLLPAAFCAFCVVFLCDATEPSLPLCLGACAGALTYALLKPSRIAGYLLAALLCGTAHVWRDQLSTSRALALRLEPGQAKAVEIRGEVLDIPRTFEASGRQPRSAFPLEVETLVPAGIAGPGSRIAVRWTGTPPACGDRVWLRASLRRIPPARNPGEPDEAAFLRRKGIWAEAVVRSPEDAGVTQAASFNWRTTADGLRTWMAAQLARGIEDRPQTHQFIVSLVLGLQSRSLTEMQSWFRDTGTMHLFAVSGLNLTMLAVFTRVILRLTPMPSRFQAAISIPVLLVYALLAGLAPSCVRALVMGLVLMGTEWTRTPAVALNSLGLAALLLLAADGNCAFDRGFQLSFGLVLFLVMCGPVAVDFATRRISPDILVPPRLWSPWQRARILILRPCADAACVTLVSWIAGVPWGLFAFQQFTPIALLANLVAVPLSFINLALGFIAILCAPFGPITPAVNRLNAACAGVLLSFIRWASLVEGGHFQIRRPFKPAPSLVVFDFGDGGAVLLRDGRSTWLLDCGNQHRAETTLPRALKEYGVQSLDTLVLSHGDSEHIGGALSVCETFKPLRVVDSPLPDRSRTRLNIQRWLTASGVTLTKALAETSLQSGGQLQCNVLHPPRSLKATLADDKVVVIRWQTKDWSILYTADAGFPTERWLLENQSDQLRSDIWIRGTHAREKTGSEEFVRAVSPRVVIVAGASGNAHHAENVEWARHWRSQGVPVWLQAETGAVEGWTGDGNKIRAFIGKESQGWSPPMGQGAQAREP